MRFVPSVCSAVTSARLRFKSRTSHALATRRARAEKRQANASRPMATATTSCILRFADHRLEASIYRSLLSIHVANAAFRIPNWLYTMRLGSARHLAALHDGGLLRKGPHLPAKKRLFFSTLCFECRAAPGLAMGIPLPRCSLCGPCAAQAVPGHLAVPEIKTLQILSCSSVPRGARGPSGVLCSFDLGFCLAFAMFAVHFLLHCVHGLPDAPEHRRHHRQA